MSDFLAVFDVDGTLVDSQSIIVKTMSRAFGKSDLAPPDPAHVRSLIGLSLPRMVADLAQGQPAEVIGRIVADYRLGFAGALEEGASPPLYPGVSEGLVRLSRAGVTLGVATGKSQRGLNRLLREQSWHATFATLQCADHHPSKPHPSMVRQALLETATEEAQAVMIGDSIYDMEMAAAGGVSALGVSWGYHSAEALTEAGAEAVAETFDGLVDMILERAK